MKFFSLLRFPLLCSLFVGLAAGSANSQTVANFTVKDIDGITQAPYCAKRHWVRVGDLGALPTPELKRRIRRSYDLVVAKLPKKVQASLAAPPGPA